jgi:spore photoproduct lyase
MKSRVHHNINPVAMRVDKMLATFLFPRRLYVKINPMNRPNDFKKSLSDHPGFARLAPEIQGFVDDLALRFRLTHQQGRQLCEIALDLQMWGGPQIQQLWPAADELPGNDKAMRQRAMELLLERWQQQKEQPNRYPRHSGANKVSLASIPVEVDKPKLGLGRCPVASPRTLCCNLQTLDAVDNCGYGCSYCSIQSFFDGKQISFDRGFADKLKQLELDPDKLYHIGTGQSSDSLMWGNSHGVLDAVLQFAADHPNVILELKTKSANVSHLLKVETPANLVCTWSLNTPTIITHEEHGTASLDKRIDAARRVADQGIVVGFHFHPIVHYDGWRHEYTAIVDRLMNDFDPKQVALVSLGTLTWIKPVMREIRDKAIPSQILKMPLVDADGKWSYPDDIKLDLFSTLYRRFSAEWRDQVFFYLCMENKRFWQPVFGFDYADNTAFEQAMKTAYRSKCGLEL